MSRGPQLEMRDHALMAALPGLWSSGIRIAEISRRFDCSHDRVRYYALKLLNLPKWREVNSARKRPELHRKDIWTDRHKEQLRALWGTGKRTNKVAEEIGKTKNAIIGMAKRMGLPPLGRTSRDAGIQQIAAHARRRRDVPPILPTKPVVEPPKPPITLNLSLPELTDDTCRFPIGDPKKPDFSFCGVKPVPDRPYCDFHCRLAYQS